MYSRLEIQRFEPPYFGIDLANDTHKKVITDYQYIKFNGGICMVEKTITIEKGKTHTKLPETCPLITFLISKLTFSI